MYIYINTYIHIITNQWSATKWHRPRSFWCILEDALALHGWGFEAIFVGRTHKLIWRESVAGAHGTAMVVVLHWNFPLQKLQVPCLGTLRCHKDPVQLVKALLPGIV